VIQCAVALVLIHAIAHMGNLDMSLTSQAGVADAVAAGF